ncbi:MAG: hypothetical protein GY906_04990 [bacterium]|nr:hypothetical protein [bacterium]
MTKLTISVLTIALVVAGISVQATELTEQKTAQPQPRAPLYVVEYDMGPEYLEGRPFAEQPGLKEHAQYMDELEAGGTIVFGGPVFEDLEAFTVSGAMLFLKVESEDEARKIAEKDPALTHGLMKIVGIKPFMAMIGEF